MPLTAAQRKRNQRERLVAQGLKRLTDTWIRPEHEPIFKALEAHSKAGTMPDMSELLGGEDAT